MRQRLLALAAVAILAFVPGCSLFYGSVNRTFAEGNKGYADLVLPEYKAYIDADPLLDSDSKEIRKGTADKWVKLIDEALAETEEE